MPVTKKITELDLANVAAGDDVPIAQGGFLKRAKAGQANGFATLNAAGQLAQNLAPGAVVVNLGYTPANRAGDAFGGTVSAPTVQTTTGTSTGGESHLQLWNGSLRWAVGLQGTEGTGNAGSNFSIWRYDNTGTYLAKALNVERANGTGTVYGNWVAPDNTYSLGANGFRWSAVWAANGTIQTSDAREKTDVQPTPLGLEFIERLRPVAYRWRVGGYVDEPIIEERQVQVGTDAEGNPIYETERHAKPNPVPVPGKRLHHGLIAQEVKAALDELGAEDFGGWVLTDPADPDSQQALRYDQFIAPLIRAVQELSARVRELEAEVHESRAKNSAGLG